MFITSRYPFDWSNPFGYLVAISLQYVIVTALFLLGAGLLLTGMSSFLFIVAAIKDVKINLNSINERGALAGNQSWTLAQLSDFVEFHAQLKQLCILEFQITAISSN